MISNSEFISLSDAGHIFGRGDLPLLQLKHPLFEACVASQGAQILSFKPKGQADWLWLDRQQGFVAGQEIIGGIPLCLPWFGRVKSPIHGFARFKDWQLVSVEEYADEVVLKFRLEHADNELASAFVAEQQVRLSDTIKLQLTVDNGQQAQDFSFAWHSYFACDCSSEVLGLSGFSYYDNLNHWQQAIQQGRLLVNKPLDRVFCQLPVQQQVSIGSLELTAENCPSCIVWRPDVQDIGYVCVERGAAFDDTIRLAAHESFGSVLTIERKG